MSQQTVHEALEAFYLQTNLALNFSNKHLLVKAKIGRFPIYMPNFSLLSNIYVHDINHMITGYKLTWKGEFELSAWEIAAGGWGKNYVAWYLCLMGVALGVFSFPKALWIAYKKGSQQTNAHFLVNSKEQILQLSFDELQQQMLTQKPITNSESRNFCFFLFWCFISLILFFGPFLLLFLLIQFIITY